MLRLFIVLVLIAALIYGYIYYKDYREAEQRREYLAYAGVIAETQVAAEIYRLQPDSFKTARDSILRHYGKTLNQMQSFKDEYKGDERRWAQLWFYVDSLTDSLVAYYDSALTADSLRKADSLESDSSQ